ncbi:hypothetical protein BFR57_07170 [Idiomarina sp. MD25a]|uniref:restriction endonuclease subunit S n=1 Tax=Idiomarina sp. MD25a TaxID=1889913 RepID=UPI0008F86996|nr:restriction endonuclease subunit S [Idiomarina sp. MD25a]OIN01829.1 hypothetical protein BFR57_07170 [Idiomarina sp. MD25a]
MVPEGWNTRNLGDLITYKKGFAFTSTDYNDSGVRIIRISDTTRDSVHSENPVYIPNEVAAKLDAHLLSTGDILLTTVGSRPHLIDSMVGKAIRVPSAASGSLLNQNLVKLIPIEGQVTNEYLFEILRKPKFRHYISTLVRGNANQVSISLSDLFKYKALMPNVREQKKIAQILSTWDKAITTTEQLLANSQQQKKALMQQLLTGKKRLLDENGVRFSEEWLRKIFGDICSFYKGYTYKSSEYSTSKTQYGFLTLKSIARGGGYSESGIKFLLNEVDEQFAISENDLVFAVTDLTRNAEVVGAPILVPRLPFYKTYISMDLMKLVPHKSIDKRFLFHLLRLKKIRNFMRARASGSTVLHLDVKGCKKLELSIPAIQEQKKVASVLDSADVQINLLKRKLDYLKREKKALMQQLLTGKRRVKIDDEIA